MALPVLLCELVDAVLFHTIWLLNYALHDSQTCKSSVNVQVVLQYIGNVHGCYDTFINNQSGLK